MDIVKTFFKAECGCEVWVFFYGPPRCWTQVLVFFCWVFQGGKMALTTDLASNSFGKNCPNTLMGVLQNCKPWMVTSSHRMLLWCLLCQHSSIAWSGTWLRRHFWWGTLGGSAGQHGWLVNCLMPHIVLEARLGQWCLNAKQNTGGFCKQKHPISKPAQAGC